VSTLAPATAAEASRGLEASAAAPAAAPILKNVLRLILIVRFLLGREPCGSPPRVSATGVTGTPTAVRA